LETAPGFDKDNWPDMGDIEWSSRVFQHYGVGVYCEEEELEEKKTLRGGGKLSHASERNTNATKGRRDRRPLGPVNMLARRSNTGRYNLGGWPVSTWHGL